MEHTPEKDPLELPKKDPWTTWGVAAGAIAILVIGGAIGYSIGFDIGYERAAGTSAPTEKDDSVDNEEQISSFEECVAAGNAVMESYPRQCRTASGQHFVEDVPPIEMPSEPSPEQPRVKDGCAVGGCSSQLCGEAGEVEALITTCEFRPEYACLQFTTCERQADGLCGWANTPEYTSCIEDPSTVK